MLSLTQRLTLATLLLRQVADDAYVDASTGASIVTCLDTTADEIVWSPDGKKNRGVAKSGTYTISYKLYYEKDLKAGVEDDTKYAYKTKAIKVEDTVKKPLVKVISREVDDVNDVKSIMDVLQTNVDMNNKDAADRSQSSFVFTGDNPGVWASDYSETAVDKTGTKRVVKYVDVMDNYSNQNWFFFTAINTTFKTK